MTQRDTDSPRDFEMTIEVAASPADVWKAIASGAEVSRWFAPEAEVEPGEGGRVLWKWGDAFRWEQTIEVWSPEEHLRTRYDSSVDDGAGGRRPLFLDFHLEGRGGATTLRLIHSGFGPEAAFDEEYDGIRRGWPVELRSLRLYLERHAGVERQVVWSVATISESHAEAWKRLTGPEGLDCGPEVESSREGDAFRFTTADGDAFEGRALTCFEHEFSGVAASHGDGFLRFSVENCGGSSLVWVWLGTYGQPQESVTALRQRWDAMVQRLFPAQAQPSEIRTARVGGEV